MMKPLLRLTLILALYFSQFNLVHGQSMADQWNNRVLYAISHDFARPTIHARNLFHTSMAMYECWAAFEPGANTYLLGKEVGGFFCAYDGIPEPDDILTAQNEAISYAVYRLIKQRFQNSPGLALINNSVDSMMLANGYDINFTSVDYRRNGPAALGNFVAQEIMAFGFMDGSNQQNDYANLFYTPVNPPLLVEQPGNPSMVNPNRWQQLTLSQTIDQNGNPISSTPPFLSPEWGNVVPFALSQEHLTVKNRDGNDYKIFVDPGHPEYLTPGEGLGLESAYKWNFCLVPIWQSHHDPADGVMWDVSPASMGNNPYYPTSFEEYLTFYDLENGGDAGIGYAINPITNEPYAPQMVPRADYARVLAEYWADGPNSVTPPGHWFKIYNRIKIHPLYEMKWKGEGEVLPALEYDVKAYLALGGALHDAAVAAWSVKGYYDYPRPVSVVRYLAEQGQCTEPGSPNFHPDGIPLLPGYIELIYEDDPLVGVNQEHLHKIKLNTWRGPDFIENPDEDMAGVGWIRAENWWPYQRPTFVTPPFAGYVSGHSTFSRSAAELLTLMTGSAYFPGGMSNFVAEQNEFLVFEQGPSTEVILQWATYRDASDQCSLSRIWGGIHPPIDDIPGRYMGMVIGPNAFEYADALVTASLAEVSEIDVSHPTINRDHIGETFTITLVFNKAMNEDFAPVISFVFDNPAGSGLASSGGAWLNNTTYEANYTVEDAAAEYFDIAIQVAQAEDAEGLAQKPFLSTEVFVYDTKYPAILATSPQTGLINDALAAEGTVHVDFDFDEDMDTAVIPVATPVHSNPVTEGIWFDSGSSSWLNEQTFRAVFNLADANQHADGVGFSLTMATDAAGNAAPLLEADNVINIDTRNPLMVEASLNTSILSLSSTGTNALIVNLAFDEEMNTSVPPALHFAVPSPVGSSLIPNAGQTFWISNTAAQVAYNLVAASEEFYDVAIDPASMTDLSGNAALANTNVTFTIDTKMPEIEIINPQAEVVSDLNMGAGGYYLHLVYSEPMDVAFPPLVGLVSGEPLGNSLVFNPLLSSWIGNNTYEARFNVNDNNLEVSSIAVSAIFARDAVGNLQMPASLPEVFQIDMRNPEISNVAVSTAGITNANIGEATFSVTVSYDEAMSPSSAPVATFSSAAPVADVLVSNTSASGWLSATIFEFVFDVLAIEIDAANVGLQLNSATDDAGNIQVPLNSESVFSMLINTLGVEGAANQDGLVLFPTLITQGGMLQLRTEYYYPSMNIDVLDAQGKVVHQLQLTEVYPGNHSLQLPQVSPGLYLFAARHGERRHTFKFIVTP